MAYKVQEYIERSGRVHVFQGSYQTLARAYVSMCMHARMYRKQRGGSFEQDRNTHVTVVTTGGARRRFTIVEKRGGNPVPFGGLLKPVGESTVLIDNLQKENNNDSQ